MKKAVMITLDGPEILGRVFRPETRRALAETLDFLPDVTGPAQLEAKKSALGQVQVLFSTWGMPALSEAQLEDTFPALEAVFYAAGTVQAFARPLLARGVRVFSAAAANAVPVAEFAVAQIVLANKGYFQSVSLAQARGFAAGRSFAEALSGNFGATVGILGAGAIGRLVIGMLRAYRAKVLVFDPFLSDADATLLGVEKAGLEEIFARCQVVSNHLANNAQTKGILSYRHFSRMPPNATFINTGRGAQVVEADLARALEEAPGRTALLDVTDPEPMAEGSVLGRLPNVYVSPHIAGSTGGEVARMGEYMLEAYRAWAAGQPAAGEVTADMLATMA